MKKEFNKSRYYIIFKKDSRYSILLKDVVSIKTGRCLIFSYIAKDNKIHRHTFHNKSISEYIEVTREQYSEYKHQSIQIKKNLKS